MAIEPATPLPANRQRTRRAMTHELTCSTCGESVAIDPRDCGIHVVCPGCQAELEVPTMKLAADDSTFVAGGQLLPGSKVAGFTIERRLGSGGMGTVFLARMDGVGGFTRLFAIKVLHPHLAKEEQFISMFLDEACLAARLHHPNAVGIVDVDEAELGYYPVMEYVDGFTLEHLLQRTADDPTARVCFGLRCLLDAIVGLDAAHGLKDDQGVPLGIVHRDVSPSNLFVCYDGTVRVVDFGIATAEDRQHRTETGMLKGKFAYMSPEQLAMKELDARSDVFALGTVFWELLTGKRLFHGDSPMETMKAVSEAVVRPPSEVNDAVPPALDAIVDKALERDPTKRYQSARELSLAIERYLSAERRSVPKAEVAEWMALLFPTGAAKRRKLIDLTRKGEAAIQLAEEAGIEYEPTSLYLVPEPTQVRPRRRAAIESTETDAKPLELSRTASKPTSATAKPNGADASGGLGRAIVTSAFILAFGGLGVAAMMLRPWEPQPELGVGTLGQATAQRPAPDTSPPPRPDAPSPQDPGTPAATADSSTGFARWPAAEEGPSDAPPATGGPPGVLDLRTRSGMATVFEGEHQLGRTPLQQELPPGRHVLSLHPQNGGPAQELTVDIRSDHTSFHNVALIRRPSSSN